MRIKKQRPSNWECACSPLKHVLSLVFYHIFVFPFTKSIVGENLQTQILSSWERGEGKAKNREGGWLGKKEWEKFLKLSFIYYAYYFSSPLYATFLKIEATCLFELTVSRHAILFVCSVAIFFNLSNTGQWWEKFREDTCTL